MLASDEQRSSISIASVLPDSEVDLVLEWITLCRESELVRARRQSSCLKVEDVPWQRSQEPKIRVGVRLTGILNIAKGRSGHEAEPSGSDENGS